MSKKYVKKKKPLKKKNSAPIPVKKLSFWATVWKYLKKGYVIGGIIFTFLSWLTFKDRIKNYFYTEHELFDQTTYLRGILIPPGVLGPADSLVIVYGDPSDSRKVTYKHAIADLEAGTDLTPRFIACGTGGSTPFDLKVRIKNNRLYIATTFKDIQKEEIVGIIDYENWRLVKQNLLDYFESDETLEVIDRGGNVIFSMVYTYPNTISLKGYFVGTCYLIVNSGIQSYEIYNKRAALNDIQKIPRLPKM